jgi:hypothetical protein
MRIAGAVAADDPWLVTGDDTERFRFEVITSGSEAMNLQATGGEGYVDLMWTQDDFDLLSGFNLYRSTSISGTYTRLNESIIPPDERTYQDTNVDPGQPYYYKFTVVKSDMSESDPSNVATGTPVDTIAPVIDHTPVAEAPPGLSLTLHADVTDNVAVQDVTLYYRAIGATSYLSKTMINTSGSRYSATIEGAQMDSPGLEYYIEAGDGVSTTRDGRAAYPHQVLVEDAPVITTISPDHGPASGGDGGRPLRQQLQGRRDGHPGRRGGRGRHGGQQQPDHLHHTRALSGGRRRDGDQPRRSERHPPAELHV